MFITPEQSGKGDNMKLPVNYNELSPRNRKQVREEYVKLQKGLCAYCGKPLNEEPTELMKAKTVTPKLYPPHFFNNPVHLHHDHETGMTIGAVHCYCNAVLWEYEGE